MSVSSRKAGSGRRRFGGLLLTLFCLAGGSPQANAQAPFLDLGIYGGVPSVTPTPVPYVAARLTALTPTANSVTAAFSLTLPLNGLKNYNFYYAPIPPAVTPHPGSDLQSGTGDPAGSGPSNPTPWPIGPSTFLPGGKYRVDYLDAAGHSKFAGTVTYTPKTDYLEGVQVPNNPPNVGPWAVAITTLGIQGRVTISVGPSTNQRPYQGAKVELLAPDATGRVLASVPTNGDGFYSFYYTYGTKEGFIPPGKYIVRVSLFGGVETQGVVYQPVTDPHSLGYYVLGAHTVANFNFPQP